MEILLTALQPLVFLRLSLIQAMTWVAWLGILEMEK